MLITVLMSVYNGEKYLNESIRSVLTQSYSDFEFVIVDDCSNDKTIEIVESFNDPRIKLLRNESNLGLSASLNRGIKSSSGKYIARHDDDDISHINRLQNQLNFMEISDNVDAVFCRYKLFDRLGNIYNSESSFYNDESAIVEALQNKTNPLAHGSAMIRSDSLINLGGYNNKFIFGQDYELWSRMIDNGHVIQMIDYVGYYHRVSFNHNKKKWQKKYSILVDKRKLIGEFEFERLSKSLYTKIINNKQQYLHIKIYGLFINYIDHIKLRLRSFYITNG